MSIGKTRLVVFAIGVASVSLTPLAGCEDNMTSCFLSGTQIATPSGPVRVEDLGVGASVISVDPISGTSSISVVQSIESVSVDEYLVVRTASGGRVNVTPHHPFWSTDVSGFEQIGDLSSGDNIARWQGGKMHQDAIVGIERKSGSGTVYHLKVDRAPHTFLADNYVVHNKPPLPPPSTIVALTVDPQNVGWIRSSNRFFGEGRDTLLFAPVGGIVELEAVPRIGWVFDHWEGNVARTDTFVVYLEVKKDVWAKCVFDSLR